MQKTCANPWCKTSFEITDEDIAFYDRVSPVFAGKKYLIPPPTQCPDCRQQRRLASCNEFTLYPGTCGLCHKKVLTEFHPKSGISYYCRDCWISDKWDALSYGREVDFSRSFIEQFEELRSVVPSLNLKVDGTLINCDYIHHAGTSKNCYLIMHADFCEDCMYGYGFKKNRSCVDGFYNLHCELCYDCVDCHKCYGLRGSHDCLNCHSGGFLRDCIGCKNCYLCVGLREREYCFENQQLSKSDYEKAVAALDHDSYRQYQALKQRRRELEEKHSFKATQGYNTENCSGDHLVNCKNVRQSFDCEDVESARYCYQLILGSKDIYDIYQYGTNLQQSYDCAVVGENSYNILFTHDCLSSSDIAYCHFAEGSRHCFGCANVLRKRFCILNKQYTETEYMALVPRVIEHMKKYGEWGEYFPATMSQFGYNETSAQMYFSLTREQALAGGYHWCDDEAPTPSAAKTIPADKLPDSINDIPDDVLHWAIICETTGKLFRITPQELKFYREQHIPLPRRYWYQRHLDRFALRNQRKLWTRQCGKCKNDIETTYSPDRPEIVYCEECYLKEVY